LYKTNSGFLPKQSSWGTPIKNIFKNLLDSVEAGDESFLVTDLSNPVAGKTIYCEKELNEVTLAERLGTLPPENNSLVFSRRSDASSLVVEHFAPKPRLIVFGGGHISASLAPMAVNLDLELWIYDDRPSFSNPARFPMARTAICDSFDSISDNITLRASDYVVVATRGHRHDECCLRFVLEGAEPFYVGLIGSRRRVAIVKIKLIDEGYSSDRLERVRTPIGLPIGAVTPAEIAVSILAEIIRDRRSNNLIPQRGRLESFADMALLKWLAAGQQDKAALITITAAYGSTPRRAGAKMVAIFDGQTVGSIGGGCAEARVITEAREIMGTCGFRLQTIDLTDSAEEDGMVCGGRMQVLIEDLSQTMSP
jgi:xanthine dehydrogenase accessory factor